jgi:amino acid transporter
MSLIVNDHMNSMTGDEKVLQAFGYRQQLKRRMGGFSSFAISFSLISVITGIFANFSFGVQQVGGALVWSWLAVGLGQFLVALVMADLSNLFPISGYGYQWSSRLTNPHLGYFVGWALLMQFVTGFPGVSQALVTTVINNPGGGTREWLVTLLTVGVITLIMLIHLFGIRLVTLVNEVGVWAEIIGVIVIITVLWFLWVFSGHMDLSNLFNSQNSFSNRPAGFSAFALSLLVGAWCLTGFEAAADLAEETHQPRKTVPRAIIGSQVAATITGFLVLAALMLSVNDVAILQQGNNPLITILDQKMGSMVVSVFTMVIVLSILACGVASMATASRLIYSMARDNMLPFSGILSRVNPTFKTPRNATLLVWALGCIFVMIIRHLEIINSISAVAGYMGYCGILISTIISKKPAINTSGFSLGKMQRPVRYIALCWTVCVVAALTLPATHVPGLQETHLPAKSTFIALIAGTFIYLFIVKRRIENKKAGPPEDNES